MNALPAVDVIVPAYNAARFLARAIDSIWQSGYPELFVYIIDDGSSDGTLALAQRLAATSPGRCFVLRHPDGGNHGVSQSRNLGIAAGKSPWIAFLDADDTYLANRFDAFRDCLVGATPDAIYEMAEIRIEDAREDDQRWDAEANPRFGIGEALDRAGLLERLLQSDTWAISAITVRRAALEFTGLFNPLLAIAEDCDLWIRLVATGQVVAGSLDRPVSLYFRHGGNSFRFSEANRMNYFASMVGARQRVRSLGASVEVLHAMDAGIRRLAKRIVHAAGPDSRCRIARELLMIAARGRVLRPLADRQLLRLAMY